MTARQLEPLKPERTLLAEHAGAERFARETLPVPLASRRALLASGVCLVVAGFSSIAAAESPSAPASVQAQIITRLLPFERGFAARSGNSVAIVIAERAKDADSASAAIQLAKALDDIGSVGGKPLRVQTVVYANAATLLAETKKRGALVVYVTPGLSGEVPAIAAAFVESGVLTVAAVESYVPRGVVLGVEVADGKPRMSINLRLARKQKLDFPSAVLKLARIY
jgi:hypothetical protein